MSLILVRWPSPLDLSQAKTCASSLRLTGTLAFLSRKRTVPAHCSSVKCGMSSKLICESSPAAWRLAIVSNVRRSLSLNFLFLISSDVMLFRRAGRDNADDFFSMMVLSVNVYYQQHDMAPGLNSCTTDG